MNKRPPQKAQGETTGEQGEVKVKERRRHAKESRAEGEQQCSRSWESVARLVSSSSSPWEGGIGLDWIGLLDLGEKAAHPAHTQTASAKGKGNASSPLPELAPLSLNAPNLF